MGRSHVSDDQGDPQPVEKPKSGIELAREALAQAKADAKRRGAQPGQTRKKRSRGGGRDPRRGGDPTAFGPAIRQLLAARGWEERVAVGGVFGRWAEIVGPELAEHTEPRTFEDGILVVAADSNAWAAQLRLLSATLVKRLNEELGHGSVQRVKVVGPSSAPRAMGRLRVTGGRRRT
jgi:predicted nucleic acid-binding Zn ribbon protein